MLWDFNEILILYIINLILFILIGKVSAHLILNKLISIENISKIGKILIYAF